MEHKGLGFGSTLLVSLTTSTAEIPSAHDVASGIGRGGENGLYSGQEHDCRDSTGVASHSGGHHDGVLGFEIGKGHGRHALEQLRDVAALASARADTLGAFGR